MIRFGSKRKTFLIKIILIKHSIRTFWITLILILNFLLLLKMLSTYLSEMLEVFHSLLRLLDLIFLYLHHLRWVSGIFHRLLWVLVMLLHHLQVFLLTCKKSTDCRLNLIKIIHQSEIILDITQWLECQFFLVLVDSYPQLLQWGNDQPNNLKKILKILTPHYLDKQCLIKTNIKLQEWLPQALQKECSINQSWTIRRWTNQTWAWIWQIYQPYLVDQEIRLSSRWSQRLLKKKMRRMNERHRCLMNDLTKNLKFLKLRVCSIQIRNRSLTVYLMTISKKKNRLLNLLENNQLLSKDLPHKNLNKSPHF